MMETLEIDCRDGSACNKGTVSVGLPEGLPWEICEQFIADEDRIYLSSEDIEKHGLKVVLASEVDGEGGAFIEPSGDLVCSECGRDG